MAQLSQLVDGPHRVLQRGGFGPRDQVAQRPFDQVPAVVGEPQQVVLGRDRDRVGGGPVGLSTLAVAVGEETETVETMIEPYLVREGYMIRTPRGRAASPRAWTHLGLRPPEGHFTEAFQLDADDGGGRFTG